MKLTALLRMLYNYLDHPLGRYDRFGTLARIIRWQLGSRLLGEAVAIPFVNGTRLLIRTGMHGATGNIYVGFMEFEDMIFALHYLREGDEFIDVGANVGVYSLLAASSGANVLAIEPVPTAYEQLIDNIYLNRFLEKLNARNIGVASHNGMLQFSTHSDSTNHVLTENEDIKASVTIAVDSLDKIAINMNPDMIKIDVEGFESEVIDGAQRLLSCNKVKVVLIELNGLGERYGFKDSVIDNKLQAYGFKPVQYEPFTRQFRILKKNKKNGNTLYIRSLNEVLTRVKSGKEISWKNISL